MIVALSTLLLAGCSAQNLGSFDMFGMGESSESESESGPTSPYESGPDDGAATGARDEASREVASRGSGYDGRSPQGAYSGRGESPRMASVPPGTPGQHLVDVTRQPLTSGIDRLTPPPEAEALRMGERARRELDDGTTQNAFDLLDVALRTSPTTVPVYVVRAQAFLIEGRQDQARADLEKAASLSPSPPWMAEILAINGESLEAQGNTTAAMTSYRRALRIFPANERAQAAMERLIGR